MISDRLMNLMKIPRDNGLIIIEIEWMAINGLDEGNKAF